MTTPDPVQAGLLEQAQSIGGVDSAGIYGDPAGASQRAPDQSPDEVAQNLVEQGAQPMSADIEALQAQIAALEAKQAAAEEAAKAAEPEPPKPVTLMDIVGSAGGALAALAEAVEHRLAALEGK